MNRRLMAKIANRCLRDDVSERGGAEHILMRINNDERDDELSGADSVDARAVMIKMLLNAAAPCRRR